jgi:hypothetical protein
MKTSSLKSCVVVIALLATGSCKNKNHGDSGTQGTTVGIQFVSAYKWIPAEPSLGRSLRHDFTALNPDYETGLLNWCLRKSCDTSELRLVIWKRGAFIGDDIRPDPVTDVPVEIKKLVPVRKGVSGAYELESANGGGFFYGLFLRGKLISVSGMDGFDDLCRKSEHSKRIFAKVLDAERGTFDASEIHTKADCDFPELINGKPGEAGVVFK